MPLKAACRKRANSSQAKRPAKKVKVKEDDTLLILELVIELIVVKDDSNNTSMDLGLEDSTLSKVLNLFEEERLRTVSDTPKVVGCDKKGRMVSASNNACSCDALSDFVNLAAV